MRSKPLIRYALLVVTTLMATFAQEKPGTWTPDTDWGHWRLGQKADPQARSISTAAALAMSAVG